jgi:hypothetical protein
VPTDINHPSRTQQEPSRIKEHETGPFSQHPFKISGEKEKEKGKKEG